MTAVPAAGPGARRYRSGAAVGLLRYGRELAAAGAAQVGDAFTDDDEADALIKSCPEAFLLGVLFTQGIPAERAWRGPGELRRRLGHLDLARLAAETEAVREAFARRPMLHRFKETLPRWVSSAARRLIDEYGGDASLIWRPGSSVAEVAERLSAFDGVGRKKAAMATEILTRCFGADLSGAHEGEAAYDVQVRRVFLRAGLVDEDSPDAIAEACRAISPRHPGSLDLPAWLIGRQTCRPRDPRCEACRIGDACPRLTHLNPEGVGARRSARQASERKTSPEGSLG